MPRLCLDWESTTAQMKQTKTPASSCCWPPFSTRKRHIRNLEHLSGPSEVTGATANCQLYHPHPTKLLCLSRCLWLKFPKALQVLTLETLYFCTLTNPKVTYSSALSFRALGAQAGPYQPYLGPSPTLPAQGLRIAISNHLHLSSWAFI